MWFAAQRNIVLVLSTSRFGYFQMCFFTLLLLSSAFKTWKEFGANFRMVTWLSDYSNGIWKYIVKCVFR